MSEKMNMMGFSQIIFKSAVDKLIPSILKMKAENTPVEEFQANLIQQTEAMARAIVSNMSEEDIESLLPEIFNGISLTFLAEDGKLEKYVKRSRVAEFKSKVIFSFTITSLLMSINQIFEWGDNPETKNNIDPVSKEPEEPTILEQ